MSDMRKFITLVENETVQEFVDPLTMAGGALVGHTVGMGVRGAQAGKQFQTTLRWRETAQLYAKKKWTISQIVHKYWPRIALNRDSSSKAYQKKFETVRNWIIASGASLRPEDEPDHWAKPDSSPDA